MVFCHQNCSNSTLRKKCSSDPEIFLKFEAEGREFAKILKFEAEGREFANILRLLEQFIRAIFNLFLEVPQV